ncbi:MAG: TIGR02186 family protein [Hyphomicrobiaceae bacterium]|nr:TIGR02186 family protein [Hyphomicrobiaceae bacterium]
MHVYRRTVEISVRRRRSGAIQLAALAALTAALLGPAIRANAQTATITPAPAATLTTAQAPSGRQQRPNTNSAELREKVQADVSTRSVSITSSFTGTEIVIFGAIENARQTKGEDDQYEIVITLEGARQRLISRRKTRVGGIWVNTQSITFADVPSYYGIASTRPLDEIADATILRQHDIGFEQIQMQPEAGWTTGLSTQDLRLFRQAVIRLKQKDRLYVQSEFGVRFVGNSLFRATVDLPANVPVGPLATRVYLFRQGRLIDTFESRVQLSRQGFERYLHDLAFGYPMIFGILAVILASGAGFAASSLFKRKR